jgi:hypothetical protein
MGIPSSKQKTFIDALTASALGIVLAVCLLFALAHLAGKRNDPGRTVYDTAGKVLGR